MVVKRLFYSFDSILSIFISMSMSEAGPYLKYFVRTTSILASGPTKASQTVEFRLCRTLEHPRDPLCLNIQFLEGIRARKTGLVARDLVCKFDVAAEV